MVHNLINFLSSEDKVLCGTRFITIRNWYFMCLHVTKPFASVDHLMFLLDLWDNILLLNGSIAHSNQNTLTWSMHEHVFYPLGVYA